MFGGQSEQTITGEGVDRKRFCPLLEVMGDKERRSSAGRKPLDLVMILCAL